MSSASKEEILSKMKDDNVEIVNLQFSDMCGSAKSVTIPVSKFEEACDSGLWFDGSSVEGFTRIFESDMRLQPDLQTYASIPWLSNGNGACARVICDVHLPNGKPYSGDPRYILKKTLEEAKEMGYEFNTGPELEFFLFKKENGCTITPAPHDKGKYFDLVMDLGFDVRRDMISALQKMGIDVEASHHEVAHGQHEIDFRYGGALSSADKVMTMKFALKAVANKHGLHASFMPKPICGINGTGMHVHQSLFDASGNNAFFDCEDKYKLSKTAYHFLGGQIRHVKAMAAILNPIVNSYKRLVPGYEAATYICWSQQNRSALIRVPRYTPGREKATRLEIRNPDPSCNPYLAFAVLLKAGLDGIKNKTAPPAPVEEDVFEFDEKQLAEKGIETLPASLWDSIKALQADSTISSVLGNDMMRKYALAKKAEWDGFRTSVTDWEVKKYLETT